MFAGRRAEISTLVASSVPNLEAEQVSVVDQRGKLLSQQGLDEEFSYTREQFRYTRELENMSRKQ